MSDFETKAKKVFDDPASDEGTSSLRHSPKERKNSPEESTNGTPPPAKAEPSPHSSPTSKKENHEAGESYVKQDRSLIFREESEPVNEAQRERQGSPKKPATSHVRMSTPKPATAMDTPATVTKRPQREEQHDYTPSHVTPQFTKDNTPQAKDFSMYNSHASRALDHSGHSIDDGDEDLSDEFFGVEDYLFPRLDPSLADWGVKQRGATREDRGGSEDAPPNCIELLIAHVLSADIRMSIYGGVLLVVLVLTIVSIPTSQLDLIGRSCYTFWGYKENCDTAAYTTPASLMSSCPQIRDRLRTGAAFSIMALIFFLLAFASCVSTVFCLRKSVKDVSNVARAVAGSFGLTAFVVQLIAWAVIASIYTARYCEEDKSQPRTTAYGVGFGMTVTAWILNIIGLVQLVALPARFRDY